MRKNEVDPVKGKSETGNRRKAERVRDSKAWFNQTNRVEGKTSLKSLKERRQKKKKNDLY